MRISYKNKSADVDAKKVSELGKLTGLMFRTRNTPILLFEFNQDTDISIHSCFVFFPFLAVWTDSDGEIIEKKVVKPFSFSVRPEKKFRKLVEIPLNSQNKKIVDFLVGKGKI